MLPPSVALIVAAYSIAVKIGRAKQGAIPFSINHQTLARLPVLDIKIQLINAGRLI